MKRYTRRQAIAAFGGASIAFLRRRALAATVRPYSERVLEKQPIAYWPLDEKSGPIARDVATHQHNGLFEGDVIFGQAGPTASETSFAIALDGKSGFVEVPDASAFSQPTSGQGLSVEAWMRPDTLVFPGQTVQRYIHWLGKGQRSEFEWGFRFYSQDSPTRPNRISAYIWNTAGAPQMSNEGAGAYFQDILEPGKWIHVVATFDPGDAGNPQAGVSIYKNGMLRGSPRHSPGARYASYGIHPAHAAAPLRFGTRDFESFFEGGLADVAIYPRVLTPDDIADNFFGA